MMGCVQYVLGKKNFEVPFEYGKKKEMSASSLSYVCDKEEVGEEVDDIISTLHKRGKN